MSIRAFSFGPADGVPPPVAPFAHATAAVDQEDVGERLVPLAEPLDPAAAGNAGSLIQINNPCRATVVTIDMSISAVASCPGFLQRKPSLLEEVKAL